MWLTDDINHNVVGMISRKVSEVLLGVGDRGPEVLQIVSKELFSVGADEVTPQVVVEIDRG